MSKWLQISEAERHEAFLSRDFQAPAVTPKPKPLGIKPTESQLWYRNVYLRSDHWQELRARKLNQSPTCYMCGSRKHIDVHHLSYANIGHESLNELMTLCRSCHKLDHENISEPEKIARERAIMDQAEQNRRDVKRAKRWEKRKGRKRRRSERWADYAMRCARAVRCGFASNHQRAFVRSHQREISRLPI